MAAVGVVLYHAYPTTFFLGWVGVDLFFVLSGFLITSIILEHIRKPGFFATFYYRRALRILPVYYLTLATVVVLNLLTRTGYSASGLPLQLVFAQNLPHYWRASGPPFIQAFDPSWSVAVEEQFYLLWPACLLFIGRRRLVPVALSLVGASVLARGAGLAFDILLTRFDGLALGAVLAQRWMTLQELPADERPAAVRSWTHLLAVVGIASALLAVAYAVRCWGDPLPPYRVFSYAIFSALFFSVVGLSVAFSGSPMLWPLRLRVLGKLGLVSYAMYMFHLPILAYGLPVLGRLGVHSAPVVGVIEWAAIFGLPALSWILVERPIGALKDARRYDRTSKSVRLPGTSSEPSSARGL
jgi:peptidoglycan/LPS O-acetylase OafA/YrhL